MGLPSPVRLGGGEAIWNPVYRRTPQQETACRPFSHMGEKTERRDGRLAHATHAFPPPVPRRGVRRATAPIGVKSA
jgi:hypothetical protein